jgi:hypothetical protein
MYHVRIKVKLTFLLCLLCSLHLSAQLSPGDLSNSHSNLEGISNCTQCHLLGNKVSDAKCLACHTEIQSRITAQKGYHSSADVTGKSCGSCHIEHNGKNSKLIRFNAEAFNHSLTGYSLTGAHAAKDCPDCHNSGFITVQKLKSRKNTYLGLNEKCLSCHTDYHQQTLPGSCFDCHGTDSFKPASKFNHSTSRFPLAGKHKTVDCLKCHRKETINGKVFQEFRGISFSNCTSCHKDPHQNQFGQNCRQCHTEESFQTVSGGLNRFDHNKTNFKLEEKHQTVGCRDCHKGKTTDPLKHDRCTDCHDDFHNGQFARNGISPDCSQCHTVKGFNYFTYTVSQHNTGKFPLNGSHSATPCLECHKKQEKWSFREIGTGCSDCHPDIHRDYIQTKYYPEADCRFCHNENRWPDISFDHSKTNYSLTGAHKMQDCRACHFRPDQAGVVKQKFTELSVDCTSCHIDNHSGQFEKNGATVCKDCHNTETWKATGFDHDKAAFRLDGKHINVPCAECHKPQKEGSVTYIRYKIKDFRCESCHLY